MEIPSSLDRLRRHPAGVRWLESLPVVIAEIADEWGLSIGRPFEGGMTSVVVPARRANGERVVLKVQFPDRETAGEADALAAWDGGGAVRLLEHDSDRHALLLERCMPGTALSEVPAHEALEVLIGALPELWIEPPAPIGTLADEVRRWRTSLPASWERTGRPFERRLVDGALEAMAELPAASGDAVLLHQDLHGDNVLRAERRPWLVIDPKPLAGEREFAVAPIVRSSELGVLRRDVDYRLDRLCDELALDRDRARRWTIVQTLAWGFEHDRVLDWHVQVARWLA